MIIETERLILRPLEEDDLDEFAEIGADKQTMRFFPNTLTYEQSEDSLYRYRDDLEENGFSLLATELVATGEMIGIIGLSKFSNDLRQAIKGQPQVEVAWRLARPYWGLGLAPEGALACLAYGFEALKLPEIVAITVPHNQPSRRVMEKIGMTYVQGADFAHPKLPKNDPISTHVLYRITAQEYEDLAEVTL